jgi:hypothetical protein
MHLLFGELKSYVLRKGFLLFKRFVFYLKHLRGLISMKLILNEKFCFQST